MYNMQIHSIEAKGILCFGDEGIKIDFDKYDKIIQVQGINHDAPGTSEQPASNGSGKSSIQELISIGLFGTSIKNPKKNKNRQIINCNSDRGFIDIQWDQFRVVRSYKRTKSGVSDQIEMWESPDRIWDDSTKKDLMPSAIKSEIARILKYTHNAFCNISVFDDSNSYSFLESDLESKRQIVENLLDLERFRGYQDDCKEDFKKFKKNYDSTLSEYEIEKTNLFSAESRLNTISIKEKEWKYKKFLEIKSIKEEYDFLKNNISKNTSGVDDSGYEKWEKAQDQIKSLIDLNQLLNQDQHKILESIHELSSSLDEVKQKIDKLDREKCVFNKLIDDKKLEKNRFEKVISSFRSLTDKKICPTCLGVVDEKNFKDVLETSESNIKEIDKDIEVTSISLNELMGEMQKHRSSFNQIKSNIISYENKRICNQTEINNNNSKINSLSLIQKPDLNADQRVDEAKMIEIKKTFDEKKRELEENLYFRELIESISMEINLSKTKIKDLNEKLIALDEERLCYEYCIEAFGDEGIRKFVINSIIPTLNERITYWMNILIDGLIEVQFDNSLEETILRNGNLVTYHSLSKGEARRVNLAISQAFAHVMMLNSGCCPNLLFLDEITGGGIDKSGVPYVFNMICELSKERQVLVTTHNETLSSLLNGCDSIVLEKRNDVTNLVNKKS